MSAVADTRGLKRICTSCGTRFYDLNKRPIHCPNCATEFTGEIKMKTRRSRVVGPANDVGDDQVKTAAVEEASEIVEQNEDVISLEDAQNLENSEAGDEEAETVEDPDLEDIDDLEDLDDEEIEEDEPLA